MDKTIEKKEVKPTKNSSEKKPVMDEANKKALNVLVKNGEKAFVKHVFTDQYSGRQLSYSEMRSRFG